MVTTSTARLCKVHLYFTNEYNHFKRHRLKYNKKENVMNPIEICVPRKVQFVFINVINTSDIKPTKFSYFQRNGFCIFHLILKQNLNIQQQ